MRKWHYVANILVLQEALNNIRKVKRGIEPGVLDELSGTVLLEESVGWLKWYQEQLIENLGLEGYWAERML